MKPSFYFKIIVMCAALAGVLVTMRRLNQSPGSMDAAHRARTVRSVEGINLCPTRVTRVETPGWSVFEDGLNWFRQVGRAREKLDPVAVEKWFSRNCTLAGRPIDQPKPTATASLAPALKMFFVSGPPLTLLRTSASEFGWMGRWFRSDQVQKALMDLRSVPAAESR